MINRLALYIILLPALCPAGERQIRLIVRGDDIGCAHAANVACIRSYEQGIMRTTELMVPGPWFPEAVRLLRQHPGLDVGVHLVLTSEWENLKWKPLTPAATLVDEGGYFYPMIWPRDDFPPNSALREADYSVTEIEAEFRAQIERAITEVPQVSHLTCHMGCAGWDEQVGACYRKLAAEYRLEIDPAELGVGRFPGFGKARSTAERVQVFIAELRRLTPGDWLFIDHPGLDTPEMRAMGHIGYEDVAADRQAVTDVFTHADVVTTVRELGIELIGYDDLIENRDTEMK